MSNTKTNNQRLILFSICVLAALLGVVFFLRSRNTPQITSFEECAQAGYPIMESYPEQCRTPNGETFTRQLPVESNLQTQTVEEIGLTFMYPKNLVYRKEIADNDGQIRTAGFFLTKGSENNPEYQMYGLLEQYKDAKLSDLELLKKEMDPKSIKDVTLGGYKGIEGLILGPKTRYVTIILKGSKLFSVSTMPPTQANKAQSEIILATFNFK